MANGDYGYFGKGDTGYAQYMTAFNRNFGGSSGGGGGHNNGGGGGSAGAYSHGKLRAYREIVDGIFLDRPNRFMLHIAGLCDCAEAAECPHGGPQSGTPDGQSGRELHHPVAAAH